MCFNTSPSDCSHQASEGHKWHTQLLTADLNYIKEHGVRVQRGGDYFNCVTDKPKERNKEKMVKIEGSIIQLLRGWHKITINIVLDLSQMSYLNLSINIFLVTNLKFKYLDK